MVSAVSPDGHDLLRYLSIILGISTLLYLFRPGMLCDSAAMDSFANSSSSNLRILILWGVTECFLPPELSKTFFYQFFDNIMLGSLLKMSFEGLCFELVPILVLSAAALPDFMLFVCVGLRGNSCGFKSCS